MRRCLVRTVLFFACALTAYPKNAPWTGVVRGSWVQTGAPGGDITLASKDTVAQVVVSDDENFGAQPEQSAPRL